MVESHTNYTVVKEGDTVYVVKNVPCLECQNCGHIVFNQDVALKLDRYVFGRIYPAKVIQGYLYRWGDPIIEYTRTSTSPNTTEYASLFNLETAGSVKI